MASKNPPYPNLGTDLQGNPLPPLFPAPSDPFNHAGISPFPNPTPSSPKGRVKLPPELGGPPDPLRPHVKTAPVDVQALRSMLVKAGYNIPTKGGSAGKLFKAALRDFLQPSATHPVGQRVLDLLGNVGPTGLRNPKGFNQRYGLNPGGKITPPTKPVMPRLNPNGTPTSADNATTFAPTSVDPSGGAGTTIDLSGLAALAKGIGGLGTYQPLVSTSYADQLAGLAHDRKIRDLGIEALRHGRDSAQSLEDIGHWYDQATAARGVAATRDHAISNAGQQSVKDAVAALVGSLGGSANMGSGEVAAAGADQTGLLSALGANEDQYNADLKPLLAAESAGAKTRQQALNTAGAQDIQNNILDEQGARGQDKANAILQILSENANRRGQNNALDQSRFQDQLALDQAAEAAQLNGAKVLGYLGKTSTAPKPPKGSFGASSTQDRTNFTKDVLSQIAPGGAVPKGMTRSKALAVARRIAHIYFPHGGIPNGTGLIASILNQAGF